mmetsp:Transcript_72293/g.202910  ORF Transcript_72293/g.202910 Transcript_72293/m.202910 type:complete len:189 (+) Transcript_72293:1425-1991(+)
MSVFATISWNNLASSKAEELSRALVGSSKIIIVGRFIMASAMQSLFFCPPESPFRMRSPTLVCWQEVSPVWVRTLSTSSSLSLASTPVPNNSAAYSTVSRAVNMLHSKGSCPTMAAQPAKRSNVRGSPSNTIRPLTPWRFRAFNVSTSNKDVLPAPLPPMIAIMRPPCALPDTSLRILLGSPFFVFTV